MSVECLAFLEFVDEAEVFLAEYGQQIKSKPESFRIITFHPLVKAHLLRQGIQSQDSFNFCPTESHRTLIDQLAVYSEEVRDNCRITDSNGVAESYTENLIFSLRGVLSAWLYRVEVVCNAIEQLSPENVVGIGEEDIHAVESAMTEAPERFLLEIIKQVCPPKWISVKTLELGSKVKCEEWNAAKIKKEGLKSLVSKIARIFIRPKPNAVIVPAESHNINCVLNEIRKNCGKKYDLAFLGMPKGLRLSGLLSCIFNSTGGTYRHLFCYTDQSAGFDNDFKDQRDKFQAKLSTLFGKWVYRNISPRNWLTSKYRNGLKEEVVNKTYFQSKFIFKFIERYNPKFVVSQHARGVTAVMGEICNSNGINSLMVPHGSFTAADSEQSKKEWKENALGMVNTMYSYVALQTPLIEDFLKEFPVKSSKVITGPLIFGAKIKTSTDIIALRNRYAKNHEKIILHAGTPKHRQYQRFINYETIDEYVDAMVKLIKAVDQMDGVHLIVRYREIDGLSEEDLKFILPQSPNYSVAADGIFSDYLAISDLLVSFSSTTLEEALQNDIPVVVFNPYNRYRHIKGQELKEQMDSIKPSAVYNVNSEKDLMFALNWIKEFHLLQPPDHEPLFGRFKYEESKITKVSDLVDGIALTEGSESEKYEHSNK